MQLPRLWPFDCCNRKRPHECRQPCALSTYIISAIIVRLKLRSAWPQALPLPVIAPMDTVQQCPSRHHLYCLKADVSRVASFPDSFFQSLPNAFVVIGSCRTTPLSVSSPALAGVTSKSRVLHELLRTAVTRPRVMTLTYSAPFLTS